MDPARRTTYIIAAISLVVIAAVFYFLFIFQKIPKEAEPQDVEGEVKQLSDLEFAKWPFVTLTPTSDGAEIVISIENMSAFDRIEYELTYLADNPQITGEKLTRGAIGTDVNTADPKYKKSILLGTASKGVRSPDKGVTDGKLTMHMFKGETEYRSETNWDLVQVGSTQTIVKDTLGNFQLAIPSLGKDYWVIVSDTIGVPPGNKDFDSQDVILPVYGAFSIAPKFNKTANLSITLIKDVETASIYSYSHQDGTWEKLEGTYNSTDNTISAKINSFATFVVTSSP